MYCKKCQVKMCEEKRSFHKRRKWICPACGKARMQESKDKNGRTSSNDSQEQ